MSSITHLPTVAYPLGLGLLATSTLTFGNLGLALCGPIPLIREQLGESKLSSRDKVHVWKLFFDAAAKWVVPCGILATTSFALIPFLTPSSLPRARTLSTLAAVSSVGALVFTILGIAPTNRRLGAIDRQFTFSDVDGKIAENLIAKWDSLHKLRCVIYAAAWVSGMGAVWDVVTAGGR